MQLLKITMIEYGNQQNKVNQEFSIHFTDMRQRIYTLNEKQQRENDWLENEIRDKIQEQKGLILEDVRKMYDFQLQMHADQILELNQKRMKEAEDTLKIMNRATRIGDKTEERMNKINLNFDKHSHMMAKILESQAALNVIINQEQKEKQTLSLFGMSLNPNQNPVGTDSQELDYNMQSENLPIKIDRNCYTCAVGSN